MLNYCTKSNRNKNLYKIVSKLIDQTTKEHDQVNQYNMSMFQFVSALLCKAQQNNTLLILQKSKPKNDIESIRVMV